MTSLPPLLIMHARSSVHCRKPVHSTRSNRLIARSISPVMPVRRTTRVMFLLVVGAAGFKVNVRGHGPHKQRARCAHGRHLGRAFEKLSRLFCEMRVIRGFGIPEKCTCV